MRHPVLLLAIAATLFAGDSKKKNPDEIGNRDVGKGINFYSLEKEIALGKDLANQVAAQAKLVTDPVVTEYVNRMVQNLVRNSDAKVPFTAQVIDAEQVNALSLPGGFLFVNTGLLLGSRNEAELAGGLAHEIAHIAARHGTRNATRGQIANFASIPLILMGGWTGYGVRQAAGLLIPMGMLTFSRSDESEADMLGLQYLYKTGYDPGAFVDFWERMAAMERRKPGTLNKLFTTHPLAGDRVTAAQKSIQQNLKPRSEYVVTTSEFQQVQDRLLALQDSRKTKPNPSKPLLRRAPGSVQEPGNEDKDGDGRPVLKRRMAEAD